MPTPPRPSRPIAAPPRPDPYATGRARPAREPRTPQSTAPGRDPATAPGRDPATAPGRDPLASPAAIRPRAFAWGWTERRSSRPALASAA